MARWQSPAYCSGLENRRRLIAVQGFESLPRRQVYGEVLLTSPYFFVIIILDKNYY